MPDMPLGGVPGAGRRPKLVRAGGERLQNGADDGRLRPDSPPLSEQAGVMHELREIAQFLPFLSLINKNTAEATGVAHVWKHPLTVRLIEACIIGALAMYGSVQGLQQELRFIRDQNAKIEQRIDKLEAVVRSVEQDNWRRRGMESLQ